MSQTEKLPLEGVTSWLKQWEKHPLSLPIIVIAMDLIFIFSLVHYLNLKNQFENLSIIIGEVLFFSGVILIYVMHLLVKKPYIFYNMLDRLREEIHHHSGSLKDALAEIDIGVGIPFENILEPIPPETRKIVNEFEILHHILKECDMCNMNEFETREINVKLFKYYYKIQAYQTALAFLNGFNEDKRDTEILFYKGLVLRKLKKYKQSISMFDLIEKDYQYATYFKNSIYIDIGNEQKIEEFLKDKRMLNSFNDVTRILLAMASFKLGTIYEDNNKDGYQTEFQHSIEYLREVINTSDDATLIMAAHYNLACYLSVMSQRGIKVKLYDEIGNKKPEEVIINLLRQAFLNKPALIEHCKFDEHLDWIKKSLPKDYYELIGRIHHGIRAFEPEDVFSDLLRPVG